MAVGLQRSIISFLWMAGFDGILLWYACSVRIEIRRFEQILIPMLKPVGLAMLLKIKRALTILMFWF